jgi:recA bacterial DNA recombination protein
MASPLVFSQAAMNRPIGFVSEERGALLSRLSALPKLRGVTAAARLEMRPAPEMVSAGIHAIDTLTGGLPRGCLTEIFGPASSGRTSILLAALAAATQRQEACALVDVTDAFDPHSAAAAKVALDRLLWVRCGHEQKPQDQERHDFSRANKISLRAGTLASKRKIEGPVEQALRVTDLLLQSGGLGMVAIDLSDVPLKMARRIPLTSWFRFQRAVENTPTVLFVIGQVPCAQTCATLLLKLGKSVVGPWSSVLGERPTTNDQGRIIPSHAQLLQGLQIEGELLRCRMERKPSRSVNAAFITKMPRAG